VHDVFPVLYYVIKLFPGDVEEVVQLPLGAPLQVFQGKRVESQDFYSQLFGPFY